MNVRAVFLVAAFLAGCFLTAFLVSPLSCSKTTELGRVLRPTVARAAPDWMTTDEKNSISVFGDCSRSVVFVVNKAYVQRPFSLDVMEIRRGAGSGIVWDSEGHIVTNYHVIHEGDAFSVILADQSPYDAEVVGAAPEKDIAVLKIKAPANKLVPLKPGTSHDLIVGQKVLAIGNPFGLDHTLTTGVVSALGREIKSLDGQRTIYDVIQTDAAINPGNSGGPLLDSQGRLVGLNTAIFSPSGAYAGIGFAVPVDTVKQVVPMLIKYGKLVRPSLGIRAVSDAMAGRLDIQGVIVYEVLRNSAAGRAGLKGVGQDRFGRLILGDIIVAIDDQPVKNYDDLLNILERRKAGDTVKLTYVRDGEKRTAQVTLQQLPE